MNRLCQSEKGVSLRTQCTFSFFFYPGHGLFYSYCKILGYCRCLFVVKGMQGEDGGKWRWREKRKSDNEKVCVKELKKM